MRYAADQLGHEDVRFTMRGYAQASKWATGWRRRRPTHSIGHLNGQHWGGSDALTVPAEDTAAV
jgi:hypothetical protein